MVDVGDRHRAHETVPGHEATSDRWKSKVMKAGIARAEPILDVAAEDPSVIDDGRDWAGGADRRWGGLPMTNPKADQRARDEPGAAPAANVASAVDFYGTACGFP